MNPEAVLGVVVGAVVLGVSIAGACQPEIPSLERRVFRAINGRPPTTRHDWGLILLWLPMQFGNLVVGTAVGLAIAWASGNETLAVASVLAAACKLVVERVVRRLTRPLLAVRQRPGTSEPGAVLRGGDVPVSGPSFPSGHAILAAAIACVITPELPTSFDWLGFALAALVVFGRVYVGAHNPLDVTAGLGLGLVIGSIVADVFV